MTRAVTFGLELPTRLNFDRVQSRLSVLVGGIYTLQSLSYICNVASLLVLYHYFNGKRSDELHSFVSPTFICKGCHAVSTMSNQPQFLRIPIVSRKFHPNTFQKSLLCETDFRVEAFSNATFLNSLSQMSIVTYPQYQRNIHFLIPDFIFI